MYGTSPEMLKKMYVAGSMVNQGDGFVFQIKNLIDSGTVSGVTKLLVDGEERLLDGVTLQMQEVVRPATEITWSASAYVGYGTTVTVYIPGNLEPGEHTINVRVNTVEAGALSIPITATLG